MPQTILVVDDEAKLRDMLRLYPEQEGYRVVEAGHGREALYVARYEKPDLILLDLMMPEMGGHEFMHVFSKEADTPVIMLTAKVEDQDKIIGLGLGADDYVTKPFSPRVLIARIRAVIRRYSRETEEDDGVIKIHELTIHSGRRSVLAGDTPLDLTFTEFQVLYFLAKRPGWVFTRSQIVDAVRGDDYPVTDRSVDVQIVGLRKKLGRFGEYIETVRGVGYRFRENP